MNDLNILHGTVVRPEGCFAGGVEVKDGTIVRVLLEGEAPDPARETVDAGNMLIFPGMIDSHVHILGGGGEGGESFDGAAVFRGVFLHIVILGGR